MLSRIWVDMGVRLENAIFANNERARLDTKKQQEETSKKCNFFDDDDDDDDDEDDDDDDDDDDDNDKKDFPVDIPFKMEDDFPSGYDDDGDVLVKKESGNEMDDRETTPFEYPKRENDIDDREAILYASPRRKSEDEIDEKIYKRSNLETPAEIEQQAKINDRNFIKK